MCSFPSARRGQPASLWAPALWRQGRHVERTGQTRSRLLDTGPETTAQSRLDQLLGQIRAAGSEAQGEVAGSDPVKAIDAAMAAGEFDEIIISTLPKGVSRWLRMDVRTASSASSRSR